MGKIAAHSAYDMFSWYKYQIVNLVFSHLGFWSGNLFLIALFLIFAYLYLSVVLLPFLVIVYFVISLTFAERENYRVEHTPDIK